MNATAGVTCPKPPAAGLFGTDHGDEHPERTAAGRPAASPSQREAFPDLFRSEGGTLHRG